MTETGSWLAGTGAMPRWVELLGIIATAGAAILAAVTITQAKAQARRSAEALIRERRIDFELGVLSDLLELVAASSSNVAARDARVTALARTMPAEATPLLRAAVRLESTPDGEAARDAQAAAAEDARSTILDHMKNAITDELVRAIEARMVERAGR